MSKSLKDQMRESLEKQDAERAQRVADGDTPEADDILGIELSQERVDVPVALVDPSPYQPRLTFNEDSIESLAGTEDVRFAAKSFF